MHEIVVIGGGLAGAAMATHLARAGRGILLLEREAGPHDKVCGEFLSFEAQNYLQQLDIDPEALGAAPIEAVAVQRGGIRQVAHLAFRGLSLSRRVLDEAVLARASEAGVEIRRGVRATTLDRAGSGWKVGLAGGEALGARHVVLATGKHDLRGWRRPPGPQPDLLGFKTYWRLPEPGSLGRTVELHLFPGGYAGLEMVEDHRTNLCLVVRRPTFVALGGRWNALLAHLVASCPGLAERLGPAIASGGRPLAISAIPYGLIQDRSDGLWRLGDQAAVIPSFTGEGMSIALHSARLASEFFEAGRPPEEFQRKLAGDLRGQVRRSALVSRALVAPLGQAMAARMLNPPLMRWMLRETRIAARAQIGPSTVRANSLHR